MSLKVQGMDELYDEWRKLEKDAEPLATAMVQAGAEVVKKSWKEAAEAYGLRDTGAMIESIGFDADPVNFGSSIEIEVLPQGKDASGTRNAEKAFIQHFGSTRIPRTGWVDTAEQWASEDALDAMEKIFDQYINTGVVPSVELTPNNKSGKPLK